MFTVLRFFLLDSMAFENICQQQYSVKPDFIEVLPGVMPRIIEKLCHLVKIKIIAGGLISDRESRGGGRLDAGASGSFLVPVIRYGGYRKQKQESCSDN